MSKRGGGKPCEIAGRSGMNIKDAQVSVVVRG